MSNSLWDSECEKVHYIWYIISYKYLENLEKIFDHQQHRIQTTQFYKKITL